MYGMAFVVDLDPSSGIGMAIRLRRNLPDADAYAKSVYR